MHKFLKKYYIVFTGITLIAFMIAFVIPFVMGVYLSFTEFTTLTDATWVGIKNYIRVFSMNDDFMNALIFTGKFALISIVSINVLSFTLALILTRTIKGTDVFCTIFFMPSLIGGIVLGYIWQLVLNGILIYGFGVNLTYSAQYGFWGLIILMNWQLIGYMMIIYIVGIGNISKNIIEAAQVDGASKVRILFSIKVPMLMSSVTICIFLTLINALKIFDQNLALTAGAPKKETQMIALDIFNTFYVRPGFEGIGQAKAVIFFLIVAIIASIYLFIIRKKEVEN